METIEATPTTGAGENSAETGSLIDSGGSQQSSQPSTQNTYFSNDGSSFSDGWLDRLPPDFVSADEASAFKTHAAKYKSPLDVIKSDFHKEKLLGRKAQAVVIPNEKSSPEEVAAYRKAAGIPDASDGYKLKPENIPAGLEWNDEVAKPFAEIAHKFNVPPAAMSALINKHMENEASRLQIATHQIETRKQEGLSSLKQEWGNNFEKNLGIAARAAKLAGVDANSDGFGDPNVVKGFVRLAGMMSEDKLIAANSSATDHPGRAAAMDIINNENNPKYKRYWGGDLSVQKEVQDGMRHG